MRNLTFYHLAATCLLPLWCIQVSCIPKIRRSVCNPELPVAKKHLEGTLKKFVALLSEEDKPKVRAVTRSSRIRQSVTCGRSSITSSSSPVPPLLFGECFRIPHHGTTPRQHHRLALRNDTDREMTFRQVDPRVYAPIKE